MSKLRADKFEIGAPSEVLEIIQGEVQKHIKDFNTNTFNHEDANKLLTTYLIISMDEGYRFAVKELMEDFSKIKELKERSDGEIFYVDNEEVKELFPLVKRRVNSKRQRKWRSEYCDKIGIKNEEETFVLSMIIATGFEYGYLKVNIIDNLIKLTCNGDEDRVKLISELLTEMTKGA